MSKVLFLQNMGDANGGIINVNKILSQHFKKDGNTCYLLSLRYGGYNDNIDFNEFDFVNIINKKDEWGLIRGDEIKRAIHSFKLIKASWLLLKRIIYKIKLQRDFIITKHKIKSINPDFIINSHYELLDAIPQEYLSKTVMHYHTNFNTVIENKNCMKKFKKYNNKIAKNIWLTSSTCVAAIKSGISNSLYIYNPVRVKSSRIANVVKNRNLLFFGRVSKEKRLDLLLQIYELVKQKNPDLNDWTLSIYGIGKFTDEQQQIININPTIKIHKPVKNVSVAFLKSSINLNTSLFEGFSMTILEANEFGIPTITFNFGETVFEQIIDKETGIIVEQNKIEQYVERLEYLMKNSEELKRISLNCKMFSKNFNSDKIYQKWKSLMRNIEEKG